MTTSSSTTAATSPVLAHLSACAVPRTAGRPACTALFILGPVKRTPTDIVLLEQLRDKCDENVEKECTLFSTVYSTHLSNLACTCVCDSDLGVKHNKATDLATGT